MDRHLSVLSQNCRGFPGGSCLSSQCWLENVKLEYNSCNGSYRPPHGKVPNLFSPQGFLSKRTILGASTLSHIWTLGKRFPYGTSLLPYYKTRDTQWEPT